MGGFFPLDEKLIFRTVGSFDDGEIQGFEISFELFVGMRLGNVDLLHYPFFHY